MSVKIKKPFIVGHRGASAIAPENTLAAFQKAIEDGAEGIELDVQPAKDGVPVVFHDFRLDRIARRRGRVIDFTSEELGNIDAGSWFNIKFPQKANPVFSAETIPTLEKLLDFLKGYKGIIYIELKCRKAESAMLVKAVCETICNSVLLPFVIVKSFDLDAIFQIKQMLPEVRTAALFAPKIRTMLKDKNILLEEAERCLADEISVQCSMATKKLVENAHKKGLTTTIWTANSPIWVKRSIELGINAVITNNPDILLAKKLEIYGV